MAVTQRSTGRGSRVRTTWRAIGAGAGVLAALVLISFAGGCYPRTPIGPAQRAPLPDALVLPTPEAVYAPSDSITTTLMRNVLFHVDDDIRLRIRRLEGRMRDRRGHQVLVLDDKEQLVVEMSRGEVALTQEDLTLLLNRYVFGYPGSPLRNLVVRTQGDRLVQRGILHKIIDIPFTMTASLSLTDDGWIRIHPDEMEIAGLDGAALLKAVGANLADMLDLSGATGVRVDGNDLLLHPLDILPPPKIEGRLTAIRVEGDRIVQVFGDSTSPEVAAITPPAGAENFIYIRGGSLRFGKLFMVRTDLITIDSDPADPFDFYLDYYHSQLVAGYHVTSPDYGLVAYMPDFDDLDSARIAGGVRPTAQAHAAHR